MRYAPKPFRPWYVKTLKQMTLSLFLQGIIVTLGVEFVVAVALAVLRPERIGEWFGVWLPRFGNWMRNSALTVHVSESYGIVTTGENPDDTDTDVLSRMLRDILVAKEWWRGKGALSSYEFEMTTERGEARVTITLVAGDPIESHEGSSWLKMTVKSSVRYRSVEKDLLEIDGLAKEVFSSIADRLHVSPTGTTVHIDLPKGGAVPSVLVRQMNSAYLTGELKEQRIRMDLGRESIDLYGGVGARFGDILKAVIAST